MTEYVSPVTQMVAQDGVAVRMVADVASQLPAVLVPYALTRGVTAVGGKPTKTSDSADVTVDEVVAAIRALMESGDTKAFGTTGEPKLAALKGQVGKAVTDALRDEAWAIVKAGV